MTVNNVNALFAHAAVRTDQTAAGKEQAAQEGFDKIMSKVNDTMSSLKAELAGSASTVTKTIEPIDTAKKDLTAESTEQRITSDSDKTADTMKQDDRGIRDAGSDQTAEEVERAAKELVKDIADEMDVTPEEVEEAMAALGLTAVQLFDIGNLKQLLIEISGSADELALVTDEMLYGNLQNLLGTVDETLGGLQEALGLSEEELNTLVEQMISDNGESDTQPNTGQEVQDVPEPELEGMKDYTVSVQRDGETVQMKVTVDDASGSKSVREEVTDTASKEEVQAGHKMREQDASADSGRQDGNAAGSAFMQTPDKLMEMSEAPASVNEGYQSAQTEDIMNQIMEYMKINLKADTQEMELRLHPASLGTVNVQIAAKDGAITAQFTTQNETVRAVIETQLIQLKEQFEEQGIKVDAVEVTVANHEYGQQFSQDNKDAERKQGKASKGTRRINLDEIGEDGEIEQMEESERIAVEMMQANGSTIDYTA
mgnify:CR=1 FL=1